MVLSLLLLGGCLKQPAAVRAATPETVAVGAVLTSVDDGATAAFPDAAMSRVNATIEARNLNARPVPFEHLSARPAGPYRLEALIGDAGDAPLRLLIEADARFFSQMNGQYRWTVDLSLTLSSSQEGAATLTDHVEVPVFLQYDHEGEPEALAAALPVLERRLGSLLDQRNRAAGN
jgi:hypothetical protein